MIGLLQRVTDAAVHVDGHCIGRIDAGLLVLVGVVREDIDSDATRLAERLATYRVFPDDADRMNRSLIDSGGAMLAVPQFTLAADTGRGRRPSFGHAAAPDEGQRLFEVFCTSVRSLGIPLETGEFGADMKVKLTNDGPMTFWLSTR
ncbi:MAG: D-aminoacyl-tRNA deacylase [Pseudomonadota bacterium]